MQFILFVISLFLTACSSSQEEPAQEPAAIPVLTTQAVTRDVPLYVEAIGTLLPQVRFEVHSEVDGRIAKVHVKEGDEVVKGALIITLDKRPFLIKVKEMKAEVASDRASLQAAKKKLERFKALADKDLISKDEWEDYVKEAMIAKANLDLSRAHLQAAKLDLAHCTIRSAINGKLSRLDLHPGKKISRESDALATISQCDSLIAECEVTEKEASLIAPLLQKSATLDIGIQSLVTPDLMSKASLYFIDAHFSDESGLLTLRAKVPNKERLFRPGQAIRVRVPIGLISNALLLPPKAIKYNEEGPYIYVVDAAQLVELRKVKTGESYGDEVVIKDGLKATDQVITDGHMRLYAGAKVKIQKL